MPTHPPRHRLIQRSPSARPHGESCCCFAPRGLDPDLRVSWQVCDLREVSAEAADAVRLALTRLLRALEPAG
jgi:hypothetical protein